MQVGCFHQLFPDCFTGPTFEQNIVGNNHGGKAGCFEHRRDVLDKIQLLVAGGRLEILTVVSQIVFFLFAFIVGKSLTALFPEWRISQHIIIGNW